MFSSDSTKVEAKENEIGSVMHELEFNGIHFIADDSFKATHIREALRKAMIEEHNDESFIFLVSIAEIYHQYKGKEEIHHAEINAALRDVVKTFIVGSTPVINIPGGIREVLLKKYEDSKAELVFADILPAVKDIKALVCSDVMPRCQEQLLVAGREHSRKELMEHKDNVLATLTDYSRAIEKDRSAGKYNRSASLRRSLDFATEMKNALSCLDEKMAQDDLEKKFVTICSDFALKQNSLYRELKGKETNHEDDIKAKHAMHKAERVQSLLGVIEICGKYKSDELRFSAFSKARRYGVEASGMFLKSFNDYVDIASEYLNLLVKILGEAKQENVTLDDTHTKIITAENKIHSILQKNFLSGRLENSIKAGIDHRVSRDDLSALTRKIITSVVTKAETFQQSKLQKFADFVGAADLELIRAKAVEIHRQFSAIVEEMKKLIAKKDHSSAPVMGR